MDHFHVKDSNLLVPSLIKKNNFFFLINKYFLKKAKIKKQYKNKINLDLLIYIYI